MLRTLATSSKFAIAALVLGAFAGQPGAVSAQTSDGRSIGEPGRSAGKKNPLKNVYFGEEHMHTRNSFDAFTAGVTQTWEDAYRFARGEAIKLSTTGATIKRRTPYDFVAITDHSEYYGVLKDLTNPKSPLSKSDFAKSLANMRTDPKAAAGAVVTLIGSLVNNKPLTEYVTPELRVGYWGKFVKTADRFNEPGKFTALYAYEWTSIPNGANMHRNVFFKNRPPVIPFSSFDSTQPEDLWTYMEIQRNQGIDVLAIPHNSNVSDGWMFGRNKFRGGGAFSGGPIDARYARRQMENEPLFEIHQTKGNSEAHPWLSPNDEFASFEPFASLIAQNVPSAVKGGYYRQGLVLGMKLESELGFNPYKMGVTAGADVHSGIQGNEEWDWQGAHGGMDDTPKKRLNPTPNATGENGYTVSSAGTTAVWATENTREGIFNGMLSKETYGTTGTLIRLRFFGGWDYSKSLVKDKAFVKKAYAGGVPMGRDLQSKPPGAKAPSFAVWALKDPESGNLDRIQIVKGWSSPRNGQPREKIYDIAWSDGREPDAKTGKLPPVGNTVDIKKATYSNNIGDSQLAAVWTDPDFNAKLKAVYYVRVLEIPTPRWSTYDAKKLGVDPPKGVPASIQERAYSSPIWYTPAAKKMAKK